MKILIVKLGALGDVLRTTPLVSALKKKYPESIVTWLTSPECFEVLQGNPAIDKLVSCSKETLQGLQKERYDWAINLDKDEPALEAMTLVTASKKTGFGKSTSGELCALDPLSEYAYRLGIDDELKFRKNKKTYQEIIFEQAGLKFEGEEYVFSLSPKNTDDAKNELKLLGLNFSAVQKPVIGLNTGSGRRFAGKKLPNDTFLKIIEKFYEQGPATVLLLGGKDELERNHELRRLSRHPIVNTGSHPIKTFAAIAGHCDLVISGDTTAMHIAIAMKVPVVAYFGSTCPQEIELYGRGKKVVSKIYCAPCYLKTCPIDEECMKKIDADEIFEAAKGVLSEANISRS